MFSNLTISLIGSLRLFKLNGIIYMFGLSFTILLALFCLFHLLFVFPPLLPSFGLTDCQYSILSSLLPYCLNLFLKKLIAVLGFTIHVFHQSTCTNVRNLQLYILNSSLICAMVSITYILHYAVNIHYITTIFFFRWSVIF